MPASTIWVDSLNALWDAIDQKPELMEGGETPIHRKFKFETNMDALPGATPAYSDLNAISIWPTTITEEFFTHRTTQFPISFDVNIWVRDWILPTALKTWMNVMDAIFQERDEVQFPADSQKLNTYVKIATGRYPRLGAVQFVREKSGSVERPDGNATHIRSVVMIDTTKDIYPR